jgi:multidrug efflux pump subunit AcrB
MLGDIATLERVYDSDAIQGFSGGARAIELDISRAPTADTLEVAAIFRAYVEEIRPQVPPGITLQVYDVRADQLSDRIWLLIDNGTSGLIVVIIILYLFLDSRIAFWICMGIPIATMATFGVMLLLGQSINMFSLFGLIMMLGVIVDDAIVIGEHTATRFEMGDSGLEAADSGVNTMMVPVIAAMATTLASFFPMFLISGSIGQIMGVLPVVVIAVVAVSLIETLLILPAHLAHALSAERQKARWSYWRQLAIGGVIAALLALWLRFGGWMGLNMDLAAALAERSLVERVAVLAMLSYLLSIVGEAAIYLWQRRTHKPGQRTDGHHVGLFRRTFDHGYRSFRDGPYNRVVTLTYDWRYVTLAVAVALMLAVGIGLVQGKHVRFAFFPSPEAERVFGRITLQPGTPAAEVEAALKAVERALDATAEKLGGGAPLIEARFARIGASGRDRGGNFADIEVQLVPSEKRSVRTPDFTRAWRDAVPKLATIQRFSVTEARGGPPGRDIDIQMTGPEADVLKRAGRDLIDYLATLPGVSGLADDLPYGKPELVLSLTPRGLALGFTIEDVGRQVRDSLEGSVARRFARGVSDSTSSGLP